MFIAVPKTECGEPLNKAVEHKEALALNCVIAKSKGVIRRRLVQAGLDWNDFNILEIKRKLGVLV